MDAAIDGIQHQGYSRITIRNSTTMDMHVKEAAGADYQRRVLAGWCRPGSSSQNSNGEGISLSSYVSFVSLAS
ncbi:MAG: hypothetical protein PHY09_14055 [Desulfuromonadaceae bacterium]|nr:hypothetical protein [Desulfuromonadaceae bacterium]